MTDIARKLLTHWRSFRKRKDPRIVLLREMPKGAVCAEIGVWKGAYSQFILTLTSPKKLHLIDPWEFQSEFSGRMYGGAVAKDQSDMDVICENVKQRYKRCQNVVLNRGKSDSVLGEFPDDYFDWVYIDGNHYYDFVLKDLTICLKKVKPGGVIAGDDYRWGEEYGFPVQKAVQDFTKEHGLRDQLKVLDSQFIIRI